MGITGKMWAHEHWYLSERDGGAPDIVTFGGRAGISGFYSTRDIGTASDDQNVNMVDVLNYGVTWKSIQDNNLLDWVQDTSSFFKIELGNIERDLGIIKNVRGNGTFLGFDTKDARSANLI